MTRHEYQIARRLIRDNGLTGLRSLNLKHRIEMEDLVFNVQHTTDELAERQSIVKWCQRENISYNFRQLAR